MSLRRDTIAAVVLMACAVSSVGAKPNTASAHTAQWEQIRAGMVLDKSHPRIEREAKALLARDPGLVAKLHRRAAPHLELIIGEIARRGLPMELAALPAVESGYNPRATSPKAAAGLWQFIPSTARDMGLQVNAKSDERRDPFASTRAALDYLELLHARFGNWELAMAAYNCGPERVDTAQSKNRRAGLPIDFWSLDLPNETEHYVPRILATAKIATGARGPALLAKRKSDDTLAALPVQPEQIGAQWDATIEKLARRQSFRAEQRRRILAHEPLLSVASTRIESIAMERGYHPSGIVERGRQRVAATE
ncbi:lytic transglycosylase domain-containing protein [Thiocystis violacea]|uniref:lytic transglycosylase domain-containing protein n=1 Tax=Thiocystis violacea TaxID=13725 RepID=UPI00190442E7|nr:lytic transglycosylase domain-containing protein [Thiocystis violacea]MBK1718099.1 hypothetical protein [Thiocystis violacea]